MRKSERKTRNLYLREIELLVWLVILLVLSVIIFFTIRHSQKSYEFHNMFMEDIDGVIVGSPVNYMGVPIGHVTKLKMIDNEIFVRFVVKDKSLKLPKGVIADVEFSGLGGSKSIELHPYDKEYIREYGLNSDNYIIVSHHQRLHDCSDLLFQIFTKISNITDRIVLFNYNFSHSNIEDKELKQDINKFIDFYDGWNDNIQKNKKYFKDKIDKTMKGFTKDE